MGLGLNPGCTIHFFLLGVRASIIIFSHLRSGLHLHMHPAYRTKHPQSRRRIRYSSLLPRHRCWCRPHGAGQHPTSPPDSHSLGSFLRRAANSGCRRPYVDSSSGFQSTLTPSFGSYGAFTKTAFHGISPLLTT